MDTRKVTLIATIAAILLLAVGIGYAYTASTQNGGNNADSEYITLVQTGTYTFANNAKVEWNTADAMDPTIATKFTLNGASQGAAADHMNGFYIKQLGTSFVIKTEERGMTSPPATLTCEITTGGTWTVFDGDHDTTFFLKIENNSTTTWFKWNGTTFQKYDTSAWDGGSDFTIAFDTGKAYKDTTVTAYYATEGTPITVTHAAGAHPVGPSDKPLNNASLTFTVTKS